MENLSLPKIAFAVVGMAKAYQQRKAVKAYQQHKAVKAYQQRKAVSRW